jgi:hypothetical protein
MALCWPVAHYTIRYVGWKHPEYHQEDLGKLTLYSMLVVFSLALTIISMVKGF